MDVSTRAIFGQPYLPMATYRFEWRCLRGGPLPQFAGSALRGCLGHALLAMSCVEAAGRCAPCQRPDLCLYPSVFEGTAAPSTVPGNRREGPSPLIFHTPYEKRARMLSPGDQWHFEVTFTGAALHEVPLLLRAFQRGLLQGFTSADLGFELERVLCLDTLSQEQALVWSRDEPYFFPHQPGVCLPSAPEASLLRCNLVSPVRIQVRRKILGWRELTFDHVWLGMRRRLLVMNECYFGGQQDLASRFSHILPEELGILPTLQWLEIPRYSSRQQRSMPVSGVMGSFLLRGDWQPLWPVLYLAQWLHAGKNAAFGNGGIRVHPVEPIYP